MKRENPLTQAYTPDLLQSKRSLRRAAVLDALGKHVRALLFVSLVLAALVIPRAVFAAPFDVDAVKAAFLHRFAAYVEWPTDATATTPFTIAVLGAPGVVENLQRLLPGLRIQNRPAQVRSIDASDPLDGIHILYIGPDQLARAQKLVSGAKGQPVLIVTDQSNGIASGAVINFVQIERNLRFEVSLVAAKRNRLQLSAGLLSVAVRIEDGRADNAAAARSQQLASRSTSVVNSWSSSQ